MNSYIGADLHSKSITFSRINLRGKLLETETVSTSELMVLKYIGSIKGKKSITFEEGPMAQWMVNIIHDKVDKYLVCDPKKNALIYKGNSNDRIDSEKLAELLLLNRLKEVVHPVQKRRQEFRELMNTYFKVTKDIRRSKCRLKSLFRMKGILCGGSKVYNPEARKDWASKLVEHKVTFNSANLYWEQIDLLTRQKDILYNEIKKQKHHFKEIEKFLIIPGVGLITAATFSAIIFDPFRFNKKSQIWTYCCLGLEENDSGINPNVSLERKRRDKIIRHLTKSGNRRLKYVLKSSAETACHRCNDNKYKRKYLKQRLNGLSESSSILTASRMISTDLWGIFKYVNKQ